MNGEELQEHARERVRELPGADLEHPFGPGWDVYKVRDKVFMLLTDVTGEPIVILKTDPEDGRVLPGTARKHHARLSHEQEALDHVAPLGRRIEAVGR